MSKLALVCVNAMLIVTILIVIYYTVGYILVRDNNIKVKLKKDLKHSLIVILIIVSSDLFFNMYIDLLFS